MRYGSLIGILFLASVMQGKDVKVQQSGTLLQMDSAECGLAENSGKTLAGEILGTDSAHKKTHALLCQEYVVQSDSVTYRIRPRDEKHPALLPVGEKAQFRMEKGKMKLRVEDLDDKEHEYSVVSMKPRLDASSRQEAEVGSRSERRTNRMASLHRIRESPWNKSTPIIVVSGRSDRQTMRESFSVGASYFLQKPVGRQKLSRLLRTVRGGMLQNRRRSARVSVHTELMCSIGMRTIRGMSWNLSQTGMQAEVFGLEPGNVVQLSFRLPPSRENIDATGVVVWVGENRQGIQFKKMSAHNQELIRNFIGELEH